MVFQLVFGETWVSSLLEVLGLLPDPTDLLVLPVVDISSPIN